MTNIEIIVVGDRCTDDSEVAVRAFGDRRVRWINLERHYGHQWAPNNEGLREARGEWVAYLGHDDIWYPTHLETALRTSAEQSADLVAAATLVYGPPGSGLRGITGLFRDGVFQPPEWSPPSSWVHRRSLVDEAGYWRDPTTLALPSDVDFMKRVLNTRISTACTDELTVFKFNAGRRDTYKIKTNDEQRKILREVLDGIDFRHRELLDLLRAESKGKLFKIEMPGDKVETEPGSVHRWNQTLKGTHAKFQDGELRTLHQRERFSIPDDFGWMEWHAEEINPTFGKFRWTGPQPRSTIDLPVRLDRDLEIRIHILSAIHPELLPPRLYVGSNSVAVEMERTPNDTIIIVAHF